MAQDKKEVYRKISNKKVTDLIAYLSVKHKLDTKHIREIVLKYQFKYARGRMSSGYWRDVRIIDFGTFKFNAIRFNKNFERVCKESEAEQQRIQELLADENNTSK